MSSLLDHEDQLSVQLQKRLNIQQLNNHHIPVKTHHNAFHINQVFTEFLYQQFSNTTLIHISQLNKPGTIIRAMRDAHVDPSSTTSSSDYMSFNDDDDENDENDNNNTETTVGTFTVQILMGKRQVLDYDDYTLANHNGGGGGGARELIHVEYFMARQLIEKLSNFNHPILSSLPLLICISLDKGFETQIQRMDTHGKQLLSTVVDLALKTIVSQSK